jgi:uncharacterized membrane protein
VSGERDQEGGRQAPEPSQPELARITQSLHVSGPLPPPAVLAKYNDVIPDGADRIMAMAERQSAHREELEAKIVAANIASQARGSLFAFILCLIGLLGGFTLIMTGKSVTGLISIVSSLTALASVFVFARREQRRERVEKAEALKSKLGR